MHEKERKSRWRTVMGNIHNSCVSHGLDMGGINHVKGDNIVGVINTADALLAYDVV